MSEIKNVVPIQASALRKGHFAMLKGNPCKITDMNTSKTGKHGHAKVNFVGVDVFTGKKYEDMCQSTHNMEAPLVNKQEYTLINIENDHLTLMDDNGELKEDVRVPEGDLGSEITNAFEDGKELQITVQSAIGKEAVLSYK